jgi:hypothetical protein
MASSEGATSFPVISGSLDDLSCIMMGIREKVIRMAAKISSVPVDDALEKLIHRKMISVVPTDTLVVPAVVRPTSTIYTPAPSSCVSGSTPSKTKMPFFENGMSIPNLDKMLTWDPSIHCHARKVMGLCTRKQVVHEDGLPMCTQCRGIYERHKPGKYTGWRGFVTEPFLRDMNPKKYDEIQKTAGGNSFKNAEGIRVMCKWYHTRYYWPYYHSSVGVVYYDIRSGMAIKKHPVDWDRGHPRDQCDPISLCDSSEIIDLKEHLNTYGWTIQE